MNSTLQSNSVSKSNGKYEQIQFKAILLMTTNEWKWVVKHFYLLQSSKKADHLFGKVFSATESFFVVVATWMKFMDRLAYLSTAVKNEIVQRQTAHLTAQISVEVMCKIRFRWMGRVQSFIRKICTERYMNTQTLFFSCTVWCMGVTATEED